MDNNNDQVQFIWNMFKDNYEKFDKYARKILEEVKNDPSKRDELAGVITGLDLGNSNENMFKNTVPSNLDVPADALLRIYQFNYDKIQKSIHGKCDWRLEA